MKRSLPNIITTARIAGAICLLYADATAGILSPFWIGYLLCGFTDMIDGYLARRFNAESELGIVLDSVADLCFVVCCAWKLFPLFTFDAWIYVWILLILAIKIINQISALMVHGNLLFPHTWANKATGLLVFATIPLFVWFDLISLVIIVSAVATFAAVQEGHYIRTKTGISHMQPADAT